MPIVSNYNMALNKDGPYSLMFLLFLTLYYEIIDSKGSILLNKKFMFKLIIISLLMTYIRNNGVYVIVLTMMSILFILGKRYLKNIIYFLLILLCLSYIPTFISCKNGNVDQMALYEIETVANRFGGKYAKQTIDNIKKEKDKFSFI